MDMPVLLVHMTHELFRADAYLTECEATVTATGPQGIVLDRTVFYPMGGGQAGDAGMLCFTSGALAGQELAIADTRKGKDMEGRFTGDICHVTAAPFDAAAPLPAVGDTLTARINWQDAIA